MSKKAELEELYRAALRKISEVAGKEDFFADIDGYDYSTYPEFIRVAVDYWAEALQRSKKGISVEEIELFKIRLAREVVETLRYGLALDLFVDSFPCYELEAAGDRIGLSGDRDYPKDTSIVITPYLVFARGFKPEPEILWPRQYAMGDADTDIKQTKIKER